jgi:hypothetical protein
MTQGRQQVFDELVLVSLKLEPALLEQVDAELAGEQARPGVVLGRSHMIRTLLAEALAARRARSAAAPQETLEAFAARAIARAKQARALYHGGRVVHSGSRVLLSYVHRASDGPLVAYKRRALEAVRAGLLAMSRADIPEIHDAADIEASEISFGAQQFHYIDTIPPPPRRRR